jgi:hypothetical protein
MYFDPRESFFITAVAEHNAFIGTNRLHAGVFASPRDP